MFENPTYIALDVPSPTADKIRVIRKKFDSERARCPVEITVAGSSGLGTVKPGQKRKDVFAKVDSVAAVLSPFSCHFVKVKKFPHTDIFYFEPSNSAEFENIHRLIAESGIEFEKSPYPYAPHCTLKLLGGTNDKITQQLIAEIPPEDEFVVDTMSVYTVEDETKSIMLHRVKLGNPNELANPDI